MAKDLLQSIVEAVGGLTDEQTASMLRHLDEDYSIEGLFAALKNLGIALSGEQRKKLTDLASSTVCELEDNELENVSGGTTYDDGGHPIVTSCNSCEPWRWYPSEGNDHRSKKVCRTCKYSEYTGGLLRCMHEDRVNN